ncbi:hypothetical protein [Halobaculum sp. MBLA0143]|uniref:hypothetical protein n=1 Tax=Halobaculum sp. MBLA0143 TaxID=3079933 RepID=UPI003526B145
MHIGPTASHRLREEIARELFGESEDSALDTDDADRPHDERARARARRDDAATEGEHTTRRDDGEADDGTTRRDDGEADDRPLAERATDSVFESEPATDVEILTGDGGE